jgi:dihydrofolate reductase
MKNKFDLVMAMSEDGYFAIDDLDNMQWTGGVDKTIFKVLSFYNNPTILCGPKTFESLPLPLQGRRVMVVRSKNKKSSYYHSAAAFAEEINFAKLKKAKHLNGSAIVGGPKLALATIEANLIKEAYITVIPKKLKNGIGWELSDLLKTRSHSKLKFRNDIELRKYVF